MSDGGALHGVTTVLVVVICVLLAFVLVICAAMLALS
jgi:hypothetical protein